ANVVLVVDRRKLDVTVQLLKILRVEDGDRQRRPLAPVLRVQELEHDVVVGVRIRGRVGAPLGKDLLAVAIENPQLEPAGLGQPRQHRDVAPAIGRPVLGDHENFRGPVRLRGEPLDASGLLIAEPPARIALAEHRAVVAARGADRPAVGVVAAEGLAGEILRAAGPLHVFVERQALGESLGSNDAPGHPILLDLRARLGRRGPSPATACGAYFHALQARLGRRGPRPATASRADLHALPAPPRPACGAYFHALQARLGRRGPSPATACGAHFHALQARLGRRGPSPATACGAHFHAQASLGAISSMNRRITRSTSARGSIEPWSNQQMICESPNASRAAWSRSTTSPASPNTPWSRQNFSYGRLARVSSIIFKRGKCSPYETGICAKTVRMFS